MNKRKTDSHLKALRISSRYVDTLIGLLAKHPYICTLIICLLINPFHLGSYETIPANAPMLGTIIVLAIGFGLIYRLCRSGKIPVRQAWIFGIIFALTNMIIFVGYSQAQDKGIWLLFIGEMIILLLYYFSETKQYLEQLNSLMILTMSFVMKFYYVINTSVYTRQHDVESFGEDTGHAGYIEYLLFHHHLPDFDVRDVWQFCHPPLHHLICAVWIEINENILGIGHDPARESLQTLTLFYSMAIVITAYKILKHFHLKGSALYIPLMIISFHPAFIMLSGSINNDVLSIAFIMGAVLCILKWYDQQTMIGILKIALCIGLGMMTKLSAALVAPSAALIFLIVFIQKRKKDGLKLFKQFAAFGAVCVPLGLWFEIRNYLKWNVPITYVQELSTDIEQYIGDLNFKDRILNFSQFSNPFEQWAYMNDSGEMIGVNECNPLIALLKTSLFGEYIDEFSFEGYTAVLSLTKPFFWLGTSLGALGLISMIVSFFLRCNANGVHKLFFGSFYTFMMLNFYKMTYDYPFVCTMNFRYITPTVIIGALFLGIMMQKFTDMKRGQTASRFVIGMSFIFSLLSMIIFTIVCHAHPLS